MTSKRRKAIIRRRIFICCCLAAIILAGSLIGIIISSISNAFKNGDNDTVSEPVTQVDKIESEIPKDDTPALNSYGLDTKYERLILVNPENPLPEDFNYEENLISIPSSYINGSLSQLDKDMWEYLKVMMDEAKKQGINLYVRSPYRSYATQKTLYDNQVQKQLNSGVSAEEAPDKAASIVARPGTSEHHTGLAVDFNIADISFNNTKEANWLKENAHNFGFILRYPEGTTETTKVIYEPWHYRFVGIEHAQKIKNLGITFEEYHEKYISKTN